MTPRDDRGVENLISQSEELIKDLPDLDVGQADAAGISTDMEASIRSQEMSALEGLETPQSDARVEIAVSADQMTAYATFYPPAGGRPPLELDDVRAALEEKGVKTGIDWEGIKAVVFTCNTELVQVSDVTVARGVKPTNETPPSLVVSKSLRENRQKADSPRGRIDFREISPYTLVRKGDVLADLIPKRSGEMGSTVRGEAVAFSKEPASALKPGRNVSLRETAAVADRDGRFMLTEESFWVDEVLRVQGDVDYHTGNIDFPGDVIIDGEIRDGFIVKAGGSLFCMKSIDASEISCGGDLVTNQGMIGRKQAVIRVGGLLRARFVEGCSVDASDSIHVQTSIMKSFVRTLNRVEMGEKGIIVGGMIYAQNGVSAAQIGTDLSPRTEIHCGIDYTIERKLLWVRDRSIALASKLKEVEGVMKSKPELRAKLTDLSVRIRKAIHQLNESARSLVQKLDRNERADVSVREVVFPGTYLEICHVSFLVSEPMKYVTFRLDKAKGKIVPMRWEKTPVRP